MSAGKAKGELFLVGDYAAISRDMSRGASEKSSAPRRADLLMPQIAWAILVVTILIVVAARVRLSGMPLERDEGEYAYAGQLLAQGIPPYTLAYNMKLPGTYAAYMVMMAIFGQTPTGI